MITKRQLKRKIKHLDFYDKSFNVIQKKVDAITIDESYLVNPDPVLIARISQYEEEFRIVSKMLTIFTYLTLPKDYSNPLTRVTSHEYKRLCTNQENANQFGIVERVGGLYMSEEEWEIYLQTYIELNEKSKKSK